MSEAEAEVVPAPAPAPDPDEPPRVVVHLPVDIRSVALAVLAVLGCVIVLHWAKAVFVPLLLGVLISYALNPAVVRLERWRVPRLAATGLVIGGMLASIGWTSSALSDDAVALIETLPEVAQKLRRSIEGSAQQTSTMDKVQQAASELEQATARDPASAASAAASMPGPQARGTTATVTTATVTTSTTRPASPATSAMPPAEAVTRVVVEKPRFNVRDYVWTGMLGLVTLAGQATIVVCIAFFLLASGSTFRRKMVKLAGPRLSQKKITVQMLDEITVQIERYLLVQLATSVIVGVATGLVFYAIGLNQAAVWAIVAGLTNLIPYLGALIVGVASAVVGFVQFESIEMGLLVGGSSFLIHALVGNLLTPWWTGRASRMNPFVVFVAVLAFGWLWGVWGLLLGVPIIMVVKAVCDRVEELKPIGELLGS